MSGSPGAAGIFDETNPPARGSIDQCVHCGFCLPTCPTYVLWGEEMDSPRGRIQLMKAGLDGRVAMTDRFVSHFDSCLGCLACVTACPSGVDYEALIEATRAQIERQHSRPLTERVMRAVIFGVAPYPGRLRAMLLVGAPIAGLGRLAARVGVLRHLPRRLRALLDLAPSLKLRSLFARVPSLTLARGERRMRVGVLTGCVQSVAFSDVNLATVSVLAAEGCEVAAPRQGCCGALELHGGLQDAARARARRLIASFEAAHVDRIVVNVAGCGSAMKRYGHLLADDPAWAGRAAAFAASVRDVSELLDELGEPRAVRHPIAATVAYHDACHLGHAQGVRKEPRAMLAAIPQLEVVELPESDVCCGSAGIFNIVNPVPAAELGARKAAHVVATDPDAVVTGNAGCLLQLTTALRQGDRSRPVVHPIQLVDASIGGRSGEELLAVPSRRR